MVSTRQVLLLLLRFWAGSWWRARSRVEVCPITCRLNSPLSELPFQVFHNIYPTNYSKQYLSNFSTVFVRHNIPTIFARQLGPFAKSTKIIITIIGFMKLAQFCNLLLLVLQQKFSYTRRYGAYLDGIPVDEGWNLLFQTKKWGPHLKGKKV